MRVNKAQRRTLVISGVGMNEGGILSVLRNVVEAAERILDPSWRIIVLAHRKSLLSVERAEVREFPDIKSSWVRRLWFEWFESNRIAKEVHAEVWLALHDITSIVNVPRQYVYCHNPTVFARPTLRALRFDKVFVAHSLFYGFLYSLNIHRNSRVFVQQKWIAEQFVRRFRAKNVMVASPSHRSSQILPFGGDDLISARPSIWIYPTFPRHFKNIELIGEALQLLESRGGWTGEVHVTIDGSENDYARWVVGRYGHLKSLKFIGRLDRFGIQKAYEEADGLIFPSRLETWGLPITEAQAYRKPILAADLEYAHETVGQYNKVAFFDPDDAEALARLLFDFSVGRGHYSGNDEASCSDFPALAGWDSLVREVCQSGYVEKSKV